MITIKNVTLRRSAKVLLEGASVTLNPGEKVGLVGRNGAGKSSLFALLNGGLHEDSGEFYIPSQWRMGQVSQDMPETDQTATAFVIEGDTVLTDARTEVAAAEASGDGDRMGHAYMALYDAGEHDASSRAQALILGLGFKTTELDNPVNSFSGGWRMRLQLARALMCPSDLLLLDEPTNHLDLATREALSMALNEFEGTVMLVSHDRALLRAVCDEFWLVGRGEIKPFDGDLDDYQRYLLEESKRLREEAKNNEADAPVVTPSAAKSEPQKPVAKIANRTPDQKKEDALLRQQKSALLKPLKKSIEQADQKIAKLEAEKLALESKLATPLPPLEIAETGKLLKTVNTALEELEVQWLAWSEELERLDLEA